MILCRAGDACTLLSNKKKCRLSHRAAQLRDGEGVGRAYCQVKVVIYSVSEHPASATVQPSCTTRFPFPQSRYHLTKEGGPCEGQERGHQRHPDRVALLTSELEEARRYNNLLNHGGGQGGHGKSNTSSDKCLFLAKNDRVLLNLAERRRGRQQFFDLWGLYSAFAQPPSTDASKTLASATSLTLLLPPRLEFGDDLFFLESALAELARDLRTQCREQLTFEFNRKTCLGTWKKHARQPSSTSHEDRILGAQIARSVVSKRTYRAYLHVVTLVAITLRPG
jgi:hypothetical protein